MPLRGWRDVLLRVKDAIGADNVSVLAAGVAFYGLLALFPAIAALVAIAGLVVEPATVEANIDQATALLPETAGEIVRGQAQEVARGGAGLGLAAVAGLLVTLWSASAATKTLMQGINVAWDERETRGFVRFNLTAYLLTLGLILGATVAIAIVAVLPAVLGALGLGDTVRILVDLARWPLLALFALLGLAVLYRVAPARPGLRWRWITPGALAATVLWLAVSVGFSLYVRNFGTYNETYGALGGVVVLLLWMWLSAFVVLLGAELDAELEHQTAVDTTVGPDRPMGARGAVKADTLGRTP